MFASPYLYKDFHQAMFKNMVEAYIKWYFSRYTMMNKLNEMKR